jgi:hypothetical protein
MPERLKQFRSEIGERRGLGCLGCRGRLACVGSFANGYGKGEAPEEGHTHGDRGSFGAANAEGV